MRSEETTGCSARMSTILRAMNAEATHSPDYRSPYGPRRCLSDRGRKRHVARWATRIQRPSISLAFPLPRGAPQGPVGFGSWPRKWSPQQAIPVLAYAGCVQAEGVPLAIESATILFTDVVGSTELSQRLSAEAADQVRREHFSILRQAIAEVGGTEVKNLGDGLMVVFGSASAALACGVAMQQGVERDNREREESVGLRVGLSGGEVTREEDDCSPWPSSGPIRHRPRWT